MQFSCAHKVAIGRNCQPTSLLTPKYKHKNLAGKKTTKNSRFKSVPCGGARPIRSGGKLFAHLNSVSSICGTPIRKSWLSAKGPLLVVKYKTARGPTTVISATMIAEDVSTFLDSEIPRHPNLVTGELPNGLRYVLFPNKTPPNRFEAHLEIHAGSVDEDEDEQGLAHLVEHVTFLGSRKREGLLGTGARSNAYTDFHHTVFHVHSPVVNGVTGKKMLPQVLEALEDIAFEPQFLYSRIEKERRAVLSEAQMMNTIEYRVDCQLLKYLHNENALGKRFPIGKTEQIKMWKADRLKNYWKKWYFPANATLYIVGDLDGGVESVRKMIEETFGGVTPGKLPSDRLAEKAPKPPEKENKKSENGSGQNGNSPSQAILGKKRHEIRPPVSHNMGLSENEEAPEGGGLADVNIFRHPLLQHFMLSVFCKLPVRKIRTKNDLKDMLMLRTLLSVLQFRINARYSQQNPPFMGIEVDISDSGREGCCVSTLTVTSEPGDWKGAVQVALQEVRRLQRHGVKPGELARYMDALLRDSEQAADLADSIQSVENLEYLMESLALDHTVMEQKDMNTIMVEVSQTIELKEVNRLAKSLLSFASDYGREAQLVEEAERNPEQWADPGPTRATSIIACVPAFMDKTGLSTGGGMPMNRGASMMTVDHVEVDSMPEISPSLDEDDSLKDFEVPDGAIKFDITEDEIKMALMDQDIDVEAGGDVDVPDDLISDEQLAQLIDERQPCFVPLDSASSAEDPTVSVDPNFGVVQRRLSNGIRLNYVHTENEPKSALLRMVVPGGKFQDGLEAGPSGVGATVVGTRTLSESGTVGDWQREQTELFCVSRLINCVLESSDEFLVMDFNFPVGGGGLKAVLQVLHLFLERPNWEESAAGRAKQIYLSNYRTQQKSLEGASMRRLALSMFGPDHRFLDPAPQEIEALTLEGMQKIVARQLTTHDMEISIVGDINSEEVEDTVLKYLGTIKAGQQAPLSSENGIEFAVPEMAERHQVWHLQDSDERACGYIAGSAPSRWGPFNSTSPVQKQAKIIPPTSDPAPTDATQLSDTLAMQKAFAIGIRRSHPLFPATVLALLTEVINSRLFTTVRDQLGLTYDVSFELVQFDRQKGGWFSVHVTSSPQKIHEALRASVDVLRNIQKQTIMGRELARAQRTLITRHESELRTNAYWLGLLTNLQSEQVPMKTAECLRDIKAMYQTVSLEDLNMAYEQFDFSDTGIYTCVGTSGKVAPPPPPEKNSGKEERSSIAATDKGPVKQAIWSAIFKAAQAVKDQQSGGKNSEDS